MAFVRADSWLAEQPGPQMLIPASWLEHRAIPTSTAIVLSLLIEGGMIAALLFLGDARQPPASRVDHSIMMIDVASSIAQTQGATAARAPQAQSIAAPVMHIDASASAGLPQEWSVTTLPPAPEASPAPSMPHAPAVPTHGFGSVGAGIGAGYDPYAFASYRPPQPPGATGAQPPLIPKAQDQLEQLLWQRLQAKGLRIDARLTVDASGHVTHVDLVSGAPAQMAAEISTTILGFALCAPDPARTSDTNVSLVLTV